MKRAFTLIEMLIVIAILGTLMGVLMVSMGGSSESARAAKCLSNMRSLATGCRNYAMSSSTKQYPLSTSAQTIKIDSAALRRGKSGTIKVNVAGWISADSSGSRPSAYGTSDETQMYCITNGALWKAVGENRDLYVCPTHVQRPGTKPWWSYQMNGWFGGDPGWSGKYSTGKSIDASGLRADRRLLFAEMPFGQTAAPYDDTAIQYKDLDGASENEELAFNHYVGKRKCAHAVFADCHVEKFEYPRGNTDPAELMSWLCRGLDISYNGSDYEKLDN